MSQNILYNNVIRQTINAMVLLRGLPRYNGGEYNEDEGLYGNVRRISDQKKFSLTLADLKTVEKNSKNAQLLDDYAVWHTNFR